MRVGSRSGGSRTIDPMRTHGASRDLVATAMVVVLVSRFVEGPAAWLVGVCLFLAVFLGTLQILGDEVPATTGSGVPVEALVAPGATVIAIFGTMRLVPAGILLLPAILIGAWLLVRVMGTESRLLASETGPSAADRTMVMAQALIVGFFAFAGMAALVPAGFPDAGTVAQAPTGAQLAALAAADGFVAFLLGYRAAALRSSNLRDVVWFASTNAVLLAIAAAALRAMEIPRLLGPALLVLVFFLWDVVHGNAPSRRRDSRRIWEAVLLAVLGVLVVAWSIRLRS